MKKLKKIKLVALSKEMLGKIKGGEDSSNMASGINLEVGKSRTFVGKH